ncbi:MAG: peptide-methionine (S)-S-oxide reductase MsrA [Ignavibacteriales bacterium]|nr:peptide-methionine (S)-S-oxide reductase MsrA [Ignavibacteriales bacterium]
MKLFYFLVIFTFLEVSCSKTSNRSISIEESKNEMNFEADSADTATFGAGCFWCVEALFQKLHGVKSVVSGYSGGVVKNPSYEDVCTGTTEHAEVIQIRYDPKKIFFDELLEIFWSSHDPTTLNRQGSDVGTQYRSVIFYHNPKQKELAEKYKKKLNDEKVFEKPVITEITAFKEFYPAENYHQNYFNNNSSKPYCQFVILPKLEKFKKAFGSKITK